MRPVLSPPARTGGPEPETVSRERPDRLVVRGIHRRLVRLREVFLRLQPRQELRALAPAARVAPDRALRPGPLYPHDVFPPVLVPAADLARVDLQHDASRKYLSA